MAKSGLVILVVSISLFSACASVRLDNSEGTSTANPSLSATARTPLLPAGSDVRAEIRKDPVIADPGGGERRSGQFSLIVYPTFVTSHLLDLSPNVQLIEEKVIPGAGTRSILARVPEDELGGVVDALKKDPAVKGAILNFILRTDGSTLEP